MGKYFNFYAWILDLHGNLSIVRNFMTRSLFSVIVCHLHRGWIWKKKTFSFLS